MPGVGEGYVSPRIRLILILSICLIITPILRDNLPAIPSSPLALSALMAGEVIIGAFLGLLMRALVSIMHIVGMIISYQSSLAAATMFDISQASQGSAIGNFLSIVAVLLLFVTDMHHLMLQGLIDSYTLFTPGNALPMGDMANQFTRTVSDIFNIGVRLASPLIAMGILMNLGAGILARLMPNMQVFFVLIPVQIQVSFLVFITIFGGMFLWYLDYVEAALTGYIAG